MVKAIDALVTFLAITITVIFLMAWFIPVLAIISVPVTIAFIAIGIIGTIWLFVGEHLE